MIKIFKTSKNVIINIDEFFDNVELGILNFKEGVNNYLDGNTKEFEANLNKVEKLEGNENLNYLQVIKRRIGWINKPLAN